MNDTPFFKRYKRETWDALQISGNSKILDVACGVGFDVIGLARRFPRADVIGIDSAHGFLGLARERARGLRNALFVGGDSPAARVTENCVSAGVLTRGEAEDWSSASKAASQSGAFLACLNIMLWEGSIPD